MSDHGSHGQETRTGEQSNADQLRLVSFNVGAERFAVDILRVQEINRMMELTRVPQSPQGVKGVINLRGRIVPVLDLRTCFHMDETEHSDDSRIIVVEVRGSTLGFIVDAVHEVLRLDPGMVEPAPSVMSNSDAGYIQGVAKVDDSLVILLDLDRLVGSDHLELITTMDTHAAA
jgi:purine-binding chemotaxis protein CheW